MKKLIALVFCILFLFTACSDKNGNKTEINENNYASYVGAGEMTLINILVNSNAEFVTDIFIKNHLPVDETKTVKNDIGVVFAPVNSEKYKTLADLKKHLASIYSAKSVDEIIGDKYIDIDGKLHFNTEYEESDYYKLDWSAPSVSATIDANGRYKLDITIQDAKGRDCVITGYAVSENGSLKLETIYY